MNHSDIAALMKGAAPAIRDYITASVQPLIDRIAELERQMEVATAVDHEAMTRAAVEAAFAACPKPADGKDADPAEIARMVKETVDRLPPAEPGRDADPEVIRSMVAEAVAALPPAERGKDADMAEVARLIADEVERAVAAVEPREPDPVKLRALIVDEVAKLPPAEPGRVAVPPTADELRELVEPIVAAAVDALPKPQDGKSVTVEELAPVVDGAVAKAIAELPAPKDGAPGKLPVAKAWDGEVTYEAEARTHKGALWQAVRDTGREPGHEDWICLAAAGEPGRDADQIEIVGTYDPGKAGRYRRLSIVALNGGAFIAKKDEPGECPGEGWQVIAMRGKAGQPGQSVKGDPGKGLKGDPGDPVVAMSVDDQGMLTLVNGDGSTVECDLYPVLAKVQG